MELDGSKNVCGICKDWVGKREWDDDKVKVKASAKGTCMRLKKPKPVHGGCDHFQKWEGEEIAR